jgi:hypothetical protein
MDFIQAQELFSNLYPGKKITYEFDEKCNRQHECVYTEGLPNAFHHIENDKVKVTVENENPVYVPITSHRETIGWEQMKQRINSKKDVYIHPQYLKQIKDQDVENAKHLISELSKFTGLTVQDIELRVKDSIS